MYIYKDRYKPCFELGYAQNRHEVSTRTTTKKEKKKNTNPNRALSPWLRRPNFSRRRRRRRPPKKITNPRQILKEITLDQNGIPL